VDRPALEVADIIRAMCDGSGAVRGVPMNAGQRYVMRCLAACRTAKMGGHVSVCLDCGEKEISYNSCRNRHCPKCQATKRAEWLEARAAEVLPTHYFHVVFTVPDDVGGVALANKRALYEILFRAASQTLLVVAADPAQLGAGIGALVVLHTWGQTLRHHPHVHCVVPGGGLSADGQQWISCGKKFFLPVRVLSQVFRGKFLDLLRRAYDDGHLHLRGKHAALADPKAFAAFIDACYRQDWVVHAKKPFGGPEVVLKYLARYTHRVAIANRRLVSFTAGQVTFRYKDYARQGRKRCMTLKAEEFLRRFTQHTLPKGFQRIRQYGLLSNRCRRSSLVECRRLLANHVTTTVMNGTIVTPTQPSATQECCSRCGGHRLVRLGVFDRRPTWLCAATPTTHEDTS